MELASWGLQLFPVHHPVERNGRLVCSCADPACASPAKHPVAALAPHGLSNATAEPAVIERWWGAGVPFNIGVATGLVSGIVALDVDPRHEGHTSLAALERRFGELPRTWRFLTGGGGEHIVFRHPGPKVANSASQVGAGIDVRGDGGYIVGPGSRHIIGRYYEISVDHHPDDVGLSDVPAWLLTLMSGPAPARGNGVPVAALPETWRKLVAEGVCEGRRNDAVARLAGLLLRQDIDPLVALDLVRCWNAQRCRPPLDDAEIVRTCNSIAGRELSRRGNHGC
jgi:putative DNA primase/helicase